jgi:hypothetical protein
MQKQQALLSNAKVAGATFYNRRRRPFTAMKK